MVSQPDVVVRLARLRAELAHDVSAMQARAAEIDELLSRRGVGDGLGRPEIIVMAVNLHGWYTALETVLERVARLLDQSVPSGGSWHIDLIDQMQLELPGVRPAALPSNVGPALNELRKFRHFFRNAYVLDLDAELVCRRAAELASIQGPVAASLAKLNAHVVATLAEIGR